MPAVKAKGLGCSMGRSTRIFIK